MVAKGIELILQIIGVILNVITYRGHIMTHKNKIKKKMSKIKFKKIFQKTILNKNFKNKFHEI